MANLSGDFQPSEIKNAIQPPIYVNRRFSYQCWGGLCSPVFICKRCKTQGYSSQSSHNQFSLISWTHGTALLVPVCPMMVSLESACQMMSYLRSRRTSKIPYQPMDIHWQRKCSSSLTTYSMLDT